MLLKENNVRAMGVTHPVGFGVNRAKASGWIEWEERQENALKK